MIVVHSTPYIVPETLARIKAFVRNGANGGLMTGVEKREATVDEKRIVYLMNVTCVPVEVPVKDIGTGKITEMVSRKVVTGDRLTLRPLVPNLLMIKSP